MRRRVVVLLAVAALTVAARLPFLLRGDRFFDSDEAVEGLMARHVPQGEFPVYMWGQPYKGVPEVYVAAAVFRVVGPGVLSLKATTLMFFTAFVCVHFVLLERLFSTRTAWIATLLLIACPPVLVFWSLSANAEFVLTLLAGTVLMLGVDAWRVTGSPRALAAAAAALGFGLWVQQFIIYYVVAMVVAALWRMPFREALGKRWILNLLLALGGLYALLGTVAFLTGGFTVTAFGIEAHAHDPQKLWRLAAVFLAAWGGGRWIEGQAGRWRAARLHLPLLALIAGYAPALGYWITAGGSPPIGRMDVHRLVAALPTILTAIVPILLGFKSPTGERLPIHAAAGLVMAFTIAVSYVAVRRSSAPPVFHMFLWSTPALFLASGAFVDAQSYRYLVPVCAALAVVYSTGVDRVMRSSRLAGIALCGVLVAIFTWQQIAWYGRLRPDTGSRAILDCLNAHHIRYASAEYWLSYKLTFLAQEQVIVAPTDGDRYSRYTDLVNAARDAPTIRVHADEAEMVECERVLNPNR